MEPVICAECGSEMRLRPGKYGKFYGCTRYPRCRGTHGAHSDGRPLGIPATAKTKLARIRAHEAFDAAWKARGLTRREGYDWLCAKLGLPPAECHIGKFTEATCDRVVTVCQIEG